MNNPQQVRIAQENMVELHIKKTEFQIFEDVVQSRAGPDSGPTEATGGQLMDFKEFLATASPEPEDDVNKNSDDDGEVKV